jgi:hypothetical protein
LNGVQLTTNQENPEQFLSLIFGAKSANFQYDASISGQLTVNGALNVIGPTSFTSFTQFLEHTLFKGDVEFAKAPLFSSDTAGFAKILQGSDTVDVKFDQEFSQVPVISMTQTAGSNNLPEVGALLGSDVRAVVTNSGKTGFTIRLNHPAPFDLLYSWIALMSKDAKTSVSNSSSEPTTVSSTSSATLSL